MTAETDRPDLQSPVDLAREADFALGVSRVSPSTREVLRGTERETLEPRVMQVLVALFQANGRVVSRDELISRCWEGRIVGEDAINRAIGRLRRLSEVDREASFVVETIPRVGYRLLAGLAAAAEARPGSASAAVDAGGGATAPPDIPPAGGQFWRRWRLTAGLALLAVAVSALATSLLWPEQHWTVESSRPLVATLALEGYPTFSPNGSMLAYTSGPDESSHKIYVRNLAGGDGIKIANDDYDDVSPSWSSDGARIAYVAQNSGEPCRIMIATVPAGEAREAGRCRSREESSVTWQPNTPFLYFIDQNERKVDAIFRIDLNTGERVKIAESKDGEKCYCGLRSSPDGKSLLYRWQEYGHTFPIVVYDLASGKENTLGRITDAVSAAWTEDSKTVLVSASSGVGSEIIAFPIDRGKPYHLYSTAARISHLAVGGGGLLAVESNVTRKNLARANASPAPQPDVIDPANGLTWSPTFAPDGTLAFLSSRSGTNAVWITRPGAPPRLLLDTGLQPLVRANFSPDGMRLAVAITSPNGVIIKILTRDGASVSSFDVPSIGNGLPTWTPDGMGVIVFDVGAAQTVRIDVDNPTHRTLAAPPPWQGITMRNGGTFATRSDKRGFWRIDNGIRLVSDKYPRAWTPPIAFRGDDVLIPDFGAAGGPRILAQPVAGGPDRVLAYAPGVIDPNQGPSAIAASPKTGEIIYVASVQPDSNIDLLTLARP